jgi:hypothetical protein
MPDTRTRAEWKARLDRALEKPLRAAQELLTQYPAVQSWLQQAATEAAMAIGTSEDPTLWGTYYDQLQAGLEQAFPELAAAVQEATEGCARPILIWRADAPHLSTVTIDFGRSYNVDLFLRLPAVTLPILEQALNRIATFLPLEPPYPRRPHEITAILAYQGRCPALRLLEHITPTGRKRTAQVFLPDQPPSAALTPEAALQRLYRYWTTA